MTDNTDAEHVADCPVCGAVHEWTPDDGLGGAFDQGWVNCPEYGEVPVDKDSARQASTE